MKLRQTGFSLVEIMMAAGMMGILSLGVMHLMTNQQAVLNHAETRTGELEIINQVRSLLADREVCLANLEGLRIGDELDHFIGAVGSPLYSVGQRYSQNGLKLESIEVQSDQLPSGEALGTAELSFTFERLRQSSGPPKVTRSVAILVKQGPDGRIQDCYSDVDGAIMTAKMKVCESLGGEYEASSERCELGCDLDHPSGAVSLDCLKERAILIGTGAPPELGTVPNCGASNTRTSIEIHNGQFVVSVRGRNTHCHSCEVEAFYDGESWSPCRSFNCVDNCGP